MTHFGEYLRSLRKMENLTLTEFGARIGVDSANLSKIENGKRDFDSKKLIRLSRSFNIDIEILKEEFYSELIAKKILENNCNIEVLDKARDKYNYLLYKKQKQTQLEF